MRTKRPGRRSRSTVAFRARNNSGTNCTSSITSGPRAISRSTNPRGSAAAARRCVSSSSVTTTPPRWPATCRASVLLPTCRGPLIATIGVSASASSTRRIARRGKFKGLTIQAQYHLLRRVVMPIRRQMVADLSTCRLRIRRSLVADLPDGSGEPHRLPRLTRTVGVGHVLCAAHSSFTEKRFS